MSLNWEAGPSGAAFPKEAARGSELSELATCLGELRGFSCSLYKAEKHRPRPYPAVRTSFGFAFGGRCAAALASGAEDGEDHPKLGEGDGAGQIQAPRSRGGRKLSGHLTGARGAGAEAGHRLSF